MNRQLKAALSIGILVVIAATVGIGMFIAFGSELGVVALVVGIPAALIAGAVVYVKTTVGERSKSTDQYTNEQAKQAARELQEIGREVVHLRDTFPNWDGDEVDRHLKEVVASMAEVGIEYDRSTNSFRVDSVEGEYQDVQAIRGEVDRARTAFQQSFQEFAREEMRRLQGLLDRLAEAGIPASEGDPHQIPDDSEDWSVDEATRQLEEQRSTITSAVNEGIRTVQQKLASSGSNDPNEIRDHISTAELELENDSYTGAVSAVIEAHRELEEQLSGDVEETRKQLLALAETILESPATAYVDRDFLDEVDSIRSQAEAIDSGLEFQEVERLRGEIRDTAISMVETMQSELRDNVDTLSTADLPGGFFTQPSSVDQDYVDRLESTADIDQFRRKWQTIAETLAADINEADTKVSVVDAYDDVAGEITDRLRSEGQVTGDELPVKQSRQFLGLYYRRNDGLVFDPDVPMLRRDDVESHSVVIEPVVEDDDDVEVEIELEGDFASKQERVPAGQIGRIESVPTGEYVLTAAAGSEYSPVKRSIRVEDDERVTLNLKQSSLRERLCEGIDDVEQYVGEFEEDIAATFESDGFVDTDVDLPVDPDFAHCLLATWAEREGYTAAETDGGDIIVFDRDQAATEIKNVIQFNLDPGDRFTYDRLRSDFLTAPLPDRIVREIGKSVADDPAVRTTEDAIVMENREEV